GGARRTCARQIPTVISTDRRGSFGRDRAGGAVNASVRHLAQPAFDRQIGRFSIDNQTLLGQSAGEWNPKALPQITDEPLHFAFSLRSIRRTQPRLETTMPGKVEK